MGSCKASSSIILSVAYKLRIFSSPFGHVPLCKLPQALLKLLVSTPRDRRAVYGVVASRSRTSLYASSSVPRLTRFYATRRASGIRGRRLSVAYLFVRSLERSSSNSFLRHATGERYTRLSPLGHVPLCTLPRALLKLLVSTPRDRRAVYGVVASRSRTSLYASSSAP